MPQDCIAIENAPLGIQSARRANIYCIGVCSTVNRNELAEADENGHPFSPIELKRIRDVVGLHMEAGEISMQN